MTLKCFLQFLKRFLLVPESWLKVNGSSLKVFQVPKTINDIVDKNIFEIAPEIKLSWFKVFGLSRSWGVWNNCDQNSVCPSRTNADVLSICTDTVTSSITADTDHTENNLQLSGPVGSVRQNRKNCSHVITWIHHRSRISLLFLSIFFHVSLMCGRGEG